MFGYDTEYTDYLGLLWTNSSGHVVGAKSMRSVWRTEFDASKKEVGVSAAAKVNFKINCPMLHISDGIVTLPAAIS